jgi:hypothetical protein
MDVMTIDPILAEINQAFNVPLDQFFGNEVLTERFVERVRERLPGCRLITSELMTRLLSLRKRGKLARLRRTYFGRRAAIGND